MEKKKSFWDRNPLRAFSSPRMFNGNFLRRLSNANISSGFTLIEVLVTLALIGVMATGIIVMVNPLAQIQKAKDTNRKSDLSQIQKALETYYQDIGKYPSSTVDYKIKGLDGNSVVWGSSWQPYMATLPKDPSSSKNYVYNSTSPDGQTYYIYASLDRGANDSQACNGGAKCNGVPSGAGCGTGATCNYGVSSLNVSP